MHSLKAVPLSKSVYWVGACDYNCRSFHGYKTPRGVTYNAYLIMGDEPVLIDTVKAPFADQMLSRIASVVAPEQIAHLISNHAEFDHSGAIPALCDIANPKVYASAAGVKALSAMYGARDYVTLTPGKALDLSGVCYTPYATPMVHWPDNVVTLAEIEGKRILFSNDAFGQHYATSRRLDVEVDLCAALEEAKTYYANIVMPYAAQAKKAVEAAKSLNADLIAPSHGVAWSKHIPDLFALYDDMVAAKKTDKAVVVYDSMWGHTDSLALETGAAFEARGCAVQYFDLEKNDLSAMIPELIDAKYLAVGCPTFYGTIMPAVAAFLSYIKALKPANLEYVVFGSYGWGGGAVKEIAASLDAMGYKHVPDMEDLTRVY